MAASSQGPFVFDTFPDRLLRLRSATGWLGKARALQVVFERVLPPAGCSREWPLRCSCYMDLAAGSLLFGIGVRVSTVLSYTATLSVGEIPSRQNLGYWRTAIPGRAGRDSPSHRFLGLRPAMVFYSSVRSYHFFASFVYSH